MSKMDRVFGSMESRLSLLSAATDGLGPGPLGGSLDRTLCKLMEQVEGLLEVVQQVRGGGGGLLSDEGGEEGLPQVEVLGRGEGGGFAGGGVAGEGVERGRECYRWRR